MPLIEASIRFADSRYDCISDEHDAGATDAAALV